MYIALHENPLVFHGNTFEDNIGLFGGAITIDTPNFVLGNYGVDPRFDYIYLPFTIIEEN